MAVNETLDIGQWLSFVSGYRMAKNLPKTSQGKLNEFVKAINADLRGIIETSTPVFFVYDSKVYLDALAELKKFLLTSDGYLYIDKIATSGQNIQRSDDEFADALQVALARMQSPDIQPDTVASKVLASKKVSKLEDFAGIVRSSVSTLNAKISTLAVGIAQGDATAAGRARYASVAAGRLVRQGFAKLTPCTLANPNSVVAGFRPGDQCIFIGANFTSIRDAINKYINAEFARVFNDAGIVLSSSSTKKDDIGRMSPSDVKKKFQIGDFVVFGHTGAKTTSSEGVSELLGINTPWTQQLMLMASQANSSVPGTDLLNNFMYASGHIDLSVEFTKEISADARMLMTGTMAIVVPMPAKLNSELVKSEGSAADAFISSLYGAGSTYLKVRKAIMANILSVEGVKKLVTGLRFSPTLTENLTENIVLALSGKPLKPVKAKSKVARNRTGSEAATNKSPPKTSTTKARIKTTPRPSIISPKGGFNEAALSSLQTILNSGLIQRIKENMGNGNRRDILNLRSGRFAESVQVERLSESRAGMITAFYTYMKNPYATFSDGGLQSYPKSRDPKLLISKSIREIAATQVGNRMRAVVV